MYRLGLSIMRLLEGTALCLVNLITKTMLSVILFVYKTVPVSIHLGYYRV